MQQSFDALVEAETGRVVVPNLEIARTIWQQTLGLMGRPALASASGLLILHCGSVHTCFVRFPIDIIFLDAEWCVLRIVTELKPWRIAGQVRGARSVLELPAGAASQTQITVGQRLRVQEAK